MPVTELQQRAAHLRDVLAPFGISALAVDYKSDEHNAKALRDAGLDSVHDFAPFDLLFDLRYDLPHRLLTSARRSALLDIDPGHLQYALAGGGYPPPRHDVLFTIGEHVNASKHAIATQRRWVYTPPCVFLPEWPVCPSPPNAPWTTISHWWGNSWMPDETGVFVLDDKRAGFEHFMDLPSLVTGPFELALDLWNDLREKARIEQHGFRVVDAHDVAASPAGYRGFIQRSAGEFSAGSQVMLGTRPLGSVIAQSAISRRGSRVWSNTQGRAQFCHLAKDFTASAIVWRRRRHCAESTNAMMMKQKRHAASQRPSLMPPPYAAGF